MAGLICELKDVQFSYTKKKQILNIPRFELKEGERIFVHGPSGCGKSTFLGIITGILKAQSGGVYILNADFMKAPSELKDKIRGIKMGYIFQLFNLIPYLTAIDNILLPCQLNPMRSACFKNNKERLEKAYELSDKFQIKSILKQNVNKISIGQQQRVAAVRALLGDPHLIIADEPISALDEDLQNIFMENLLEQCKQQNTALIFVSHDKRFVNEFQKNVLFTQINRLEV